MIANTEKLVINLESIIADLEQMGARLEKVLADVGDKNTKKGRAEGIDPVCWDCAEAIRFDLAPGSNPAYLPCRVWRTTGQCAWKPLADASRSNLKVEGDGR